MVYILPMSNAPQMTTTTAAFRQASRLGATIGRVEYDGKLTASRKRIAREAFEIAFRDVIRHEDRGIDSGWIGDRLTSERQLAMRTGLLTAADVIRIEREVCQEA